MRWGKTAAAIAAVGFGVWAGSMLTTFASSIPVAGQPGSAEDPVVTKSYVDEQIRKALGGGVAPSGGGGTSGVSSIEYELLLKRIAALEQELEQSGGGVPYAVVKLKAGHMLIGEMGTEFIVRNGEAYVHSTPENGIADVTDGVDLPLDALIPKNHMLLVPREGRGVKVKPDYPNDVYVTVKGNFTEMDADGNVVKP